MTFTRRHIYLALIFTALTLQAMLCSTAYAADTGSRAIERGDKFFALRGANHINKKALPANTQNAIKLYLEAYDAGEPSAELIIKIMRSSYFLITYTDAKKELKKEYVTKAIEIGGAGLKTYSESAGINYWLAALWGRWSKLYGRIASSKNNVAVKIKDYAERTIELDPSYCEGGGYRTLGRLHFKTPRIPFLLPWPRKKLALKFLEKALQEGPDNLTNHLFYAEALINRGKKKEADKELRFVQTALTTEETIVEDIQAKQSANELMKVVHDKQDTRQNSTFGRIR